MAERTHRQYLSDMDKKIDRIHTILIGDEEAKQDGLVHKVERNSAYIRKDKKFKWTVATMLFGGTGSFMAWAKTHLGL